MSQGPAHVVMLVTNDVVRDTRVKKEAVALARAGLQVTVVGLAPDGKPDESRIGPVRVLRQPVPFTIKDGLAARRARRRAAYPPLGYRTPAEAEAARLWWTSRIRDLGSRRPGAGPAGRLVRALLVLALKQLRRLVDVREASQRRARAALASAWRRWDARRARSTRRVSWRRELPDLLDWERALATVVEGLRPDVVHAHDAHTVATAAHAAARLGIPWVYDAHEYVRGEAVYGRYSPRVVAAYAALEAEFVHDAAGVITVSPMIAAELERVYRLPERPRVVLNAPTSGVPATGASVRDAAGLDGDVPLLVYSGNLTPVRGVESMIDALALLPGVHLALVVPHVINTYGQSLLDRARDLGVADRLHVVPPVASEQVSAYLSTATAGVHGLHRFPSHDMALPNKLFEYVHARLPLVVSDVPAMAGFVRDHGLGEVYRTADATDLARAARLVLDRADSLRPAFSDALLAEFSWEPQADALRELYRRLLPGRVHEPGQLLPPLSLEESRREEPATPFVAIGPANMAGQGWEWARALERAVPGLAAESLAVDAAFRFRSDEAVDARTFTRDRQWQLTRERRALATWTHAVFEAGRPLLGTQNGTTFVADAALLAREGITVALVHHGSELRSPRRHRALYEHSPFHDRTVPLFELLQRKVDELAPLVAAFEGPKLVSTPDLLDELPEATWLPVVVDHTIWVPGEAPLQRTRPVVVHAPSNPALKGSALIEPAVQALHDKGLIEYRRLDGVAPERMPAVLAEADVVLDHFVIGNYGVLTVQALAQGRVTVGHVHPRVRDRLPEPLPVIEATPGDLGEVLERIVAERSWAQGVAAQGPTYSRRWHDGTHSGHVLARSLGLGHP